MTIDVDTLVFLELLAGAELTLVLLLVGRLLRGEPGLWPWVAAMASVAGGSAAMSVGGGSTAMLLVGSLLLALGPALAWLGARDRCGFARRPAPIVTSLVIVGGAVLLSPGARTAQTATSLAAAAWSAALVWTFLHESPSPRRIGTRAAAALFVLHGAFQIARAFFPLPADAEPLFGLREWPRVLSAVGAIFFAVAWSFTVLGLTSQRLLAKLRDAARTDRLTGLLNRFAFVDDAGRALEFCRRRGRPCVVVLADIDHFKRLNDTQGHAAGDRALQLFADTAARAAGKAIVLGRYGGEEFCALLPGADAEQGRAWADRLREEIAASAPFTVSFGVAAGSGAELDLTRLIARADEALYRAKADGRNRVYG